MNHDAFGELTEVAEELWSRKIDVSIFNQTMTFDLYVDVFEDEGVQEVQVQAFEQFNGDWAKTCPSVEQALLAYYQSICEQYRDQLDVTDPNDERVPLIDDVKDLAALLKPDGVDFPGTYDEPTFGLRFYCTWDPEHGCGVMIQNGKVTQVGSQDILL